ncbi:MAG: energy-coupling factor ABC transporter substrate-binding protein [Rhodospirillaceae bacterium]|nr:energy-coupling factor ABC transporter substrate-binding protein [Rhodospirillaceae bacterium]
MTRQNVILILLAVAISILPLFMFSNGSAEFTGADGQAEGIIQEMHPTYEPWAAPLWEPPSGEIESALFALQAAIGAGVLGYVLGRRRRDSGKV